MFGDFWRRQELRPSSEPNIATQVAQHGAGMPVLDWARLLHRLRQKKILTDEEISSLLTEAVASLRSHNDEVANDAAGVVLTIAQAELQSAPAKTT